MTLSLYNTRTRQKEHFAPLQPGRVTMYVCGPTVYSFPHIGNARPAVVFDVLARLLRTRYQLTYARNITDIDDKINRAAAAEGVSIGEIAARYASAYHADMRALGVLAPDIEPRATEHLAGIISMISSLIDSGHAYAADGHVLFRVSSFADYGALSRRDQRELLAGARVEVAPYKEGAGDFVLWKPSTPDLPGWDSPWSRGRPGWHIECSAMVAEHLGPTIDIHGGGNDLIFPHHENEIAQSRCANGGALFARYWLHNGFVNVDHTKMSKSLGNVLLVRQLLEQAPGEAIRLALLAAHYRQPLDWTSEVLPEARRKLDRLYGALRDVEGWQSLEAAPDPEFIAALDDDLNTPQALAVLFNLARDANRSSDPAERAALAARLRASAALLGLLGVDPDAWFMTETGDGLSAEQVETLLAARRAARASRDFKLADQIRDQLVAAGILIEDSAEGTRWRRSAG
ncbi:MAG: cysteine--tRNA ligase [Chromatiales bacterium]|jgi:cysteinyl-tRNA synthetase|nr:cysteine--tRNA ligase [Chromatiales bacterium]